MVPAETHSTNREAAIAEMPPVVRPAARPFLELPLLEADRALDDARRLVALKVMAGWPDEVIRDQVQPAAAARDLAATLGGLNIPEATRLVERMRTVVWAFAFHDDPGSTFGRYFQAAVGGGAGRTNRGGMH